jgi:hypothetical protein
MSQPYQIVPSFSSVYLTANQTIGAVWETILFNIIETDGTNPQIYNPTTGLFTAPVSGWYDLNVHLQTSATLTGVRIVKNGDPNFPCIARVPADGIADIYLRIQLGAGETLSVDVIGVANVLALAGTTPNARASNAIFTMVKRFDQTQTF